MLSARMKILSQAMPEVVIGARPIARGAPDVLDVGGTTLQADSGSRAESVTASALGNIPQNVVVKVPPFGESEFEQIAAVHAIGIL